MQRAAIRYSQRDPSEISLGDRATLSASFRPGQCGGALGLWRSRLTTGDDQPSDLTALLVLPGLLAHTRGVYSMALPTARAPKERVPFCATAKSYLIAGYFLNKACVALLISFSKLVGFPSARVDMPSQTLRCVRGSMRFT